LENACVYPLASTKIDEKTSLGEYLVEGIFIAEQPFVELLAETTITKMFLNYPVLPDISTKYIDNV
jgi:hypothetical protein